MAHECISCGGECYCNGDIDDCIISHTPTNCTTCGCEDDKEEFDDDYDEDYTDFEEYDEKT